MRGLTARPNLSAQTARRMANETQEIAGIQNTGEQHAMAVRRYNSSRGAKWFSPVLVALKRMTGEGQRCMLCSGSEAAQVEHYRPKNTYPLQALAWPNLLWICGVCNLSKGDSFDEHCQPINPAEEFPWDYFFIDEFGNFCAKWAPETNSLNSRAVETIRLYGLDRQALQETRFARLRELKRFLNDSIALNAQGQLSEEDLQTRALDFHANPLQPDVGDYFLNGPGQLEPIFSEFFVAAGL